MVSRSCYTTEVCKSGWSFGCQCTSELKTRRCLGRSSLGCRSSNRHAGDDHKLTNGTGWAPTAVAGPCVLAGEMLVEELGGQCRFGRVVWEEKAEM
ncbi:unnamed protein product [Sphagnum jensenii]